MEREGEREKGREQERGEGTGERGEVKERGMEEVIGD